MILIIGAIFPLGFAPFDMPGASILSLSAFYYMVNQSFGKDAFSYGFLWALGCGLIGLSWIIFSIHDYGHLNIIISGVFTLCFLCFIALFYGVFSVVYRMFVMPYPYANILFFAALWVMFEWVRSHLFGGFPWLLAGTSQLFTPLSYLLPIIGIYGVSFLVVLASGLLAEGLTQKNKYAWAACIVAVLIIMSPALLQDNSTPIIPHKSYKANIIQANLSMRDKWDEAIFWKILRFYHTTLTQLSNSIDISVLPESAIPMPKSYVEDYLEELNQIALTKKMALIVGIPNLILESNNYQNTMLGLGYAKGTYRKQQLVPFGEYIPDLFSKIVNWLAIPIGGIVPGHHNQALLKVFNHPVAGLICYEIAYPNLLRSQLPESEYIISLSDDGWFGHSLAIYQHRQLAQILAIMTHRYHVFANNDGLSSIINENGIIVKQAAAYTQEMVQADVYPFKNKTLWVVYGDSPILWLMSFIIIIFCGRYLMVKIKKKDH